MKNGIRIGITVGDPAGIGPEVILKALKRLRPRKTLSFKIYTPPQVLKTRARQMKIAYKEFLPFVSWPSPAPKNPVPRPGKPTRRSAALALKALDSGIADLKSGAVHALVTAPLNKKNIAAIRRGFDGHTGYLARAFSAVNRTAMMLTARDLRVVLITEHVPLRKVPGAVTTRKIIRKTRTAADALKNLMGIRNPCIGILGLNPHLGDRGLYGDEEEKIILPAVQTLRREGYHIEGPLSPDTAFIYTRCDAYMVMYHDQGLILQKYLARGAGVNLTLGLPGIRTSPDHGTAYDIAPAFSADAGSMVQAIESAYRMARRLRGRGGRKSKDSFSRS